MVVVNKDRLYAYGYPDVNMVASNTGCGCNPVVANHRGPFIGLSGTSTGTASLLAVVAVFGTLAFLNKVTRNKHLV